MIQDALIQTLLDHLFGARLGSVIFIKGEHFSENIERSEAGPLQFECFLAGNSNGLKQGRFNVCVHVASNSNGLKQDRFNLHVWGRKLKRSETGPLQYVCFWPQIQTV